MNNAHNKLSKGQLIKLYISDFSALVKFRLSATVVFSSVMAYLIAYSSALVLNKILLLALGGFLVTGAANVLNEVLERDYDKLMKRTANRPLASGRMESSNAVLLAGFMSLFGISALALFNPATGLLGMIALVSYAFVYTPLKRESPVAVTIGALAGALPTMIGAVAAEGTLSLLGFTLFAIQFLWQFTHFWSIAFLGFEDYKKAGYRFIPARNGKASRAIAQQALTYALLLIPVGAIPFYLEIVGVLSTVGVLVLSILFSYFAWNFYKQFDRSSALRLMFSSFFYIPLVLLIYFFDKI
ncbi:MAG: heme o synthase [Bacteroidota bacterium]